jgi:phage gp36-like protein
MPYATRADFTKHGLPADALADVPTESQDAALDAASSEADTYLANVFTLPLIAPFPPILVQQVCAIAAWNLLTTVGFDPQNGADSAVKSRCEDARRWLERISTSRATLVGAVDSSDPPEVVEGGVFVVSAPSRGWGDFR